MARLTPSTINAARRPRQAEPMARHEPVQPQAVADEPEHRAGARELAWQAQPDQHAENHQQQAAEHRDDPLAPVERGGEAQPGRLPAPQPRHLERQHRRRQQRAQRRQQIRQRVEAAAAQQHQHAADQRERDQRRQADQKRLARGTELAEAVGASARQTHDAHHDAATPGLPRRRPLMPGRPPGCRDRCARGRAVRPPARVRPPGAWWRRPGRTPPPGSSAR